MPPPTHPDHTPHPHLPHPPRIRHIEGLASMDEAVAGATAAAPPPHAPRRACGCQARHATPPAAPLNSFLVWECTDHVPACFNTWRTHSSRSTMCVCLLASCGTTHRRRHRTTAQQARGKPRARSHHQLAVAPRHPHPREPRVVISRRDEPTTAFSQKRSYRRDLRVTI
jgi:hypothetical protein